MMNTIEHPLRYKPDHGDFVCINGAERFNRPIYCGNSAFRVDAGDVPVFALFLPGRGGNLRFAVKSEGVFKWLDEAPQIEARYRPGSMRYIVGGPTMGNAKIEIVLLAEPGVNGCVAKVELSGADEIDFYCAFGGADGSKGSRNIDIGCEKIPVRDMAFFKPEFATDNTYELNPAGFVMKCKAGVVTCQASPATEWKTLDGNQWGQEQMFSNPQPATQLPVMGSVMKLKRSSPLFVRLQKAETLDVPANYSALFDQCEKSRQEIASHISVDTPDEFINAAVAALCVASNGTWDEKQSAFMHGAVAWRVKLLGWRGAYAGDALGWHDRTRRHLDEFFKLQNTSAIPGKIPAPEPESNLARNETALHSNGDMTKSHYDMNLVAVDAFFRHLLWTGDLDYARQNWPVIQRHLAWEKRLLRREFKDAKTGDMLPLYEGYCCFWASDDVAYNGGGATHSSAYNYYHNKMAARVAKLIGQDGSAYEKEADLILRGMNALLWSDSQKTFGEFKDLLGEQKLHDIPAVWSIYHTIDSECATPEQAKQMTQWIDANIARFPLKGAGMPEGFYTIPTSNWMPFTWSTNNVVMAETAHTSLAYYQADRRDDAFALLKGCILDSMYSGLCPGNVGMCTKFDAVRRESQRDFADGCGALSRTIVEGLFGLTPDMLAGEIRFSPKFPASWDHATLNHPDLSISFKVEADRDVYVIESRTGKPFAVKSPFGNSPAALKHRLVGSRAQRLAREVSKPVVSSESTSQSTELQLPAGKYEPVGLSNFFNDNVTQIFKNEYLSPRSPFCSLATPKQGFGSWCKPKASFDVIDSGLRSLGGKVSLAPGIELTSPAEGKNIIFTSQWDNYPKQVTVPLTGTARQAVLMLAGSTGAMQSRFDNGEIVVTYQDGTTTRLALHNPTTWWPIDQDYMIDDFAFNRPEPLPIRVDLKTGQVRNLTMKEFKGTGKRVDGGAATVLAMPLDAGRQLKSIQVRAIANEVVIGLMSVTLQRD